MLQFNLLASDHMSILYICTCTKHIADRVPHSIGPVGNIQIKWKLYVLREWRRRVRVKMKWFGLKSERKVNIFNGVTFSILKERKAKNTKYRTLFLRFLCLYIWQGHLEPKRLTHFVNWKLMNSIWNMRPLIISPEWNWIYFTKY